MIESNVHSNLKLEEIAFLCNMSLSTFKRHFIVEYNEAPGKWLQDKRLQRANSKGRSIKSFRYYTGLQQSF
jgi:transcriptional regulator GlxA family with amidase domain